jgi:capsular polysaccharide transport system permease protein
VFFVYQGVPQPWRDWLWWNPIVHVVGATRAGIYPAYRADYVSTLYVMGIAAVTFLAGLFFLRRYYRSILYDL